MYTKEDVIRLYSKENMSPKDIASLTGWANRTVHQWLQGLPKNPNIPKEKTGPKPRVPVKEIIQLYQEENLGIKLISEKVGLSARTVAHHLKKQSVPKNPNAVNHKTGPKVKIPIETLVKEYASGKDTYELAKQFELDPKTVWHHINNSEHPVRPRGTTVNKRANLEFFSKKNISHESMYWLGFIFGDGNILDKRLSIGLASKDKEHLEKFKTDLDMDSKLLEKESLSPCFEKTGTVCHSSTTRLHGEGLIQDLVTFGIKENKSYVGGSPLSVPREYQNSFLLGLIDADGWIGLSKGKYCVGHCGHYDLVHYVQKCFQEHLEIDLNIHPRQNIWTIQTSAKKNLEKIFTWLIKDLEYSLPRKRKRIHAFLSGI